MAHRSRATKSKSQDRQGWCVIFHHPARLDEAGKAVRVRKGLRTRDNAEADALVAELNELLANAEWHSPAARDRAAAKFNNRIVAIFFDEMEAETPDGWALREQVLPLPGTEEGYARVLLCGTTGAGKTTLLRQLIGTDPDTERFPSTSTAKTTVADIEIIIGGGPYRAAVSFFSREKVRGYIEECVVAAIGAAAEGSDAVRVASLLLEHREQRFRLAYLLGTLADIGTGEDDWDDEVAPAKDAADAITDDERAALRARLQSFVSRVLALGAQARERLASAFSVDPAKLDGPNRDAFLEMLEEEVLVDEECQALIDDILDDVEAKFELLNKVGTMTRSRSGWPDRWTWESDSRAEFIRAINRLSSNYAANFGRLLTPLVQGIRVSGPFAPSWAADEPPRLVLLDGEGLGHTSESVQSVPTQMTRRFSDVNVIALVDSATQPMLSGPSAVVRAATATGHDRKLVLLFTHFDEVRGPNLPTTSAKREHVQRSVDGALSGLDTILGGTTVRGLKRNLEGRVLFLAGIDQRLDRFASPAMRRVTEAALRELVAVCAASIIPPAPVAAHPIYDFGNLVLAIAAATGRFQRAWEARLGIEVRPGVRPEHWTRVKALSRRFAEWGEDAYDDMRPVADLFRELTEGLANFVANPRGWEPNNASDELRQEALEAVRRAVSTRIDALAATRLRTGPLVQWRHAYHLAGKGSGRQRPRDIWSIYVDAAPRLTEVPTPEGAGFMDAVRELFAAAVQEAGGRLTGSP